MFKTINLTLKSTVFRLSLIAAGLFVLSSFVVLIYIYYATVTSQLNDIDRGIQDELNEIEEIYRAQGRDAANREVSIRMRITNARYHYFFQQGEFFTSSFTTPAKFEDFDTPNKPFRFVYYFAEGTDGLEDAEIHRARAQFRDFNETDRLIIGRDAELIIATSERVRRALLIAMAIALILGLASGVYVSRRFARRINSFNKLATDIRAGDLSRRAKRTESGDELDDLADHLNGMLDHIDRLMSAMRYAGDSIAHDLRSPLTRLRTSLESTAHQVKDPVAKNALHGAAENANELLQTFESVLRIARLEAGDRRELLVDVDPKPLMDDLAELYEPSCEDAGLSFTSNIHSGLRIQADRGLLSQAVSNLIENAIKYTPDGGAIRLDLKKNKAGRVEISVIDTGTGIPPAERQRVKERFVRLEKSRSQAGSGLGLSLVQAIADLHQASFEFTDGMGHDPLTPGLGAALIFPRRKASRGLSRSSGNA